MIGAGAPAQTLGRSHPSHTMRATEPLDSARRPAHPVPLPFLLLVPVDQIYRWSPAATPLLAGGSAAPPSTGLVAAPPAPARKRTHLLLAGHPCHLHSSLGRHMTLTPAARPSVGSSSSRHGCNIPEAPPAPPLVTVVQFEAPCPRQKHKLH